MKVLWWAALALYLALAGCAPATYRYETPSLEAPTGPGTIPPSWYYYDPSLREWFSPWYVNPYQQG